MHAQTQACQQQCPLSHCLPPLSCLQATQVANQCSELVLQRDLDNFVAKLSTVTAVDAMHDAAKFTVPVSIVGSTAYWRSNLQDMTARCKKHGMPSLFSTLTCDEVKHKVQGDGRRRGTCASHRVFWGGHERVHIHGASPALCVRSKLLHRMQGLMHFQVPKPCHL